MRRAALLLAVIAPVALAAPGPLPEAGRVARPAYEAGRGEACVAPTAEMRRDHMRMLLHQRDRTLRQGIRETRFSLKGCVECHAGSTSGSVLGEEGFCSSCHAYTAVRMDCFECHSAMRQGSAAR